MSIRSRSSQKTVAIDWHDDVVAIAVEARRAGMSGPLHDMVISHYFCGLAVPRHESDWHMPTLRSELQHLANQQNASLARKAGAALRKLP